ARRCLGEAASPQEEPSGLAGEVECGALTRVEGTCSCPRGSVSVTARGWRSNRLTAANRCAPRARSTRVSALRATGAPCMRQNGGWCAGDSLLYELYVLG